MIPLTMVRRFYLVLICPSVLYLPVIWFLFPETKGRTLEEIGEIFGDKHVAAHVSRLMGKRVTRTTWLHVEFRMARDDRLSNALLVLDIC